MVIAPIGAKIFPHILSYIEEGKTVAEAEVTELKTTEQLPSSTFEVPAGAVSKPSCLNPTAGRLIRKVNPSYPESERRSHMQGTVAIYAVIGLHALRIVSGVSPGLIDEQYRKIKTSCSVCTNYRGGSRCDLLGKSNSDRGAWKALPLFGGRVKLYGLRQSSKLGRGHSLHAKNCN
jgi:hypothetical protein